MTEPKTVLAMKTVPCPWRQNIPVSLDICIACEFHKEVQEIIEHRWNPALGKTEPQKDGEVVKCHYPRVIRIGAVVTGA